MIINDVLKKFDAKFTIEDTGNLREVNDEILDNVEIIKNDETTFILHNKDEFGLFELIVSSNNEVHFNFFDETGEMDMSYSYFEDHMEIN